MPQKQSAMTTPATAPMMAITLHVSEPSSWQVHEMLLLPLHSSEVQPHAPERTHCEQVGLSWGLSYSGMYPYSGQDSENVDASSASRRPGAGGGAEGEKLLPHGSPSARQYEGVGHESPLLLLRLDERLLPACHRHAEEH